MNRKCFARFNRILLLLFFALAIFCETPNLCYAQYITTYSNSQFGYVNPFHPLGYGSPSRYPPISYGYGPGYGPFGTLGFMGGLTMPFGGSFLSPPMIYNSLDQMSLFSPVGFGTNSLYGILGTSYLFGGLGGFTGFGYPNAYNAIGGWL